MEQRHPFGEQLKAFRKARGLTQAALAGRSGYALSTIRKLEAGVLRPSRHLANQLANALELDPDERASFETLICATGYSGAPQRVLPTLQPAAHIAGSNAEAILAGHTSLPFTPLLGRHDDMAHVRAVLDQPDVRVVTLAGPGGVGKTRLAWELMVTTRPRFADGGVFVSLADLRDHTLVPAAVAQALHVPESGHSSLTELLIQYVRDKQLLLVLDNFEHVLPAAAFVATLVSVATRLRVLVTSRVVLGVYGEQNIHIAPLPLPAGPPLGDVTNLALNPAVALFVQRAHAVNDSFTLTATNAAAIVAICRQLDGLPLAIELAAAWTRVLPAAAIRARLDKRLDLLTLHARTVVDRHQALRTTLEWSYRLLPKPAQELFMQLAVFAGGTRLSAIEELCGGTAKPSVLERLATLVAHSLVDADTQTEDEPCYTMLQTIREYAWERLAKSGQVTALQWRHAHYFRQLVERAEPEFTGPDQTAWLERCEQEHDNLRVALGWVIGNDSAEDALRLATALGRFWWLRGHLTEGRKWLTEALSIDRGVPSSLRAKGLYWLGILALMQGADSAAGQTLAESLEVYRTVEDQRGIGLALNALGVAANRRGDHRAAQEAYEASLALYRTTEGSERVATVLNNLGFTLILTGAYREAEILLQESLHRSQELEDTQGEAFALNNLGLVALARRDTAAATFFQESLTRFVALGDQRNSAEVLEGLAQVALAEGSASRAAALLGAATSIRARLAAPLPHYAREQVEHARARARTQLGAHDFRVAWHAGNGMSYTEAITYALGRGDADGGH